MERVGRRDGVFYFKPCTCDVVKKIASLHHMPNKGIIREALVD